jgi:hypothetical protein
VLLHIARNVVQIVNTKVKKNKVASVSSQGYVFTIPGILHYELLLNNYQTTKNEEKIKTSSKRKPLLLSDAALR